MYSFGKRAGRQGLTLSALSALFQERTHVTWQADPLNAAITTHEIMDIPMFHFSQS